MAYVLLADRLRAQVLADRQIAGALLAAGAQDVELPDPDEVAERFDAMLAEEPRRIDPEQAELARALGVA